MFNHHAKKQHHAPPPPQPAKNPMTPPVVSANNVQLIPRQTDADLALEDVDGRESVFSAYQFQQPPHHFTNDGAAKATPQQQAFKVTRGAVAMAETPQPAAAAHAPSAAAPGKLHAGKSTVGLRQHSLAHRQSSVVGGSHATAAGPRASFAGGVLGGAGEPGSPFGGGGGGTSSGGSQLLVLGGSDVGNANPAMLNKLRRRMGSLAADTEAMAAAQAAAGPDAPDAPQRSLLSGSSKRLLPIMSMSVVNPLLKARWRTFRQLFSFVPVFCIVVCVLCSCALLTGVLWTIEKNVGTLENAVAWREYSPSQGLCHCKNLRKSDCGDRDKYFAGVTSINTLLLCVESAMLLLLSWELAGYGVFGGPQYLSRGQLALSLVSMACAGLSIGAFYAVYTTRFCGALTYKRQGLQIGWGFFLRGIEIGGHISHVALVAYTGLGANRGPPTFSLFLVTLVTCSSVFSTLSHTWMSSKDATEDYGAFMTCQCGIKRCTDETKFDSQLKFNMVLTIFQLLAFVTAAFFTFLRAVDNLGGTVKMCQIAGAAGAVITLVNIIVFTSSLPYSTPCGGRTIEFESGLAVNLFVGVVVSAFLFLVTNGMYLSRFLTPLYEQKVMDLEFEYTGTRLKYYCAGRKKENGEVAAAADTSDAALVQIDRFNDTQGFGGGMASKRPRPVHHVVSLAENNSKVLKDTESDVRTFFQAFYWDELQDRRTQLQELSELLEAQEDSSARSLECDLKDATKSAKMFDLKKFFF